MMLTVPFGSMLSSSISVTVIDTVLETPGISCSGSGSAVILAVLLPIVVLPVFSLEPSLSLKIFASPSLSSTYLAVMIAFSHVSLKITVIVA